MSRWIIVVLAVSVGAFLVVNWLEAPPSDPADACIVFREKPSWYGSLQTSEAAWGVSKAVQLAILYQESSFRARVRPPRRKLFGILPWRRPSTAYGYGQILDGTWAEYQRRRDRPDAKRSSFGDVADFVGWYVDQIHRVTGVSKADAYNLYLAYHEGPGGYSRGSHNHKAWLLETSMKVQNRARRYQRQLDRCESSLRWAHLRRRLIQAGSLVMTAVVFVVLLRKKGRRRKRRRRRRP